MRFEQLNGWGACSSVMVRDFSTTDELETNLVFWLKKFCRLYGEELPETVTLGEGTHCEHMSYVVASTVKAQKIAIQGLRILGFYEHPAEYNEKNSSKPTLWVAGISSLDKKVAEIRQRLEKGDTFDE